MAESAYGLLLLGRHVATAAFALLLVVGGVWASWGTAQHVMLAKGREHGTMTVRACGDDQCAGSYTPDGQGGERRDRVVVDHSVADEGERVPVTVKPGTDEVVRAGLPGLLYAWAPLGGALLLASLVVAGGLRLTRTAWATGAVGALLLAGAFLTL
ncbi:hypothetical protein GUY61_13540 [Streptomyces sp. GC420]|nr:hypothetical protein [Streptomyces sp. GC420]